MIGKNQNARQQGLLVLKSDDLDHPQPAITVMLPSGHREGQLMFSTHFWSESTSVTTISRITG
jgi:hypothetical protein